jgi:hypothetical protein
MRVIDLPASLDFQTVDALFAEVVGVAGAKVLFDARHLRWVGPNGMVGLLAAGSVARDRSGEAPILELSGADDVERYLGRMGFFEAAKGIFAVGTSFPRRPSGPSDVLLEITPITKNSDVHDVVERIQEAAGAILSNTLGYPQTSVVQFSVILSEVCQNILEHAGVPGWVAAQSYNWSKRLGRHVVIISVADLGRGFRGSLSDEHSARFADRWGDVTALEAAFIHGLTRFPDSGRGQGIRQIRKQVRRWDGVISIRSGTARIADVPEWFDAPPLEEGLSDFPGTQINILLPERVDHAD